MVVKIKVTILIFLTCILSGIAADEGFKRYQVIIDSHPFGEEPAEAEVVQISLNESFARSLRLTMLFEGADDIVWAGFVDSVKKKNYILSIGEIQDDLELVEIDLAANEAMLRNKKEVALFKLEEAPEILSKKQQDSRALTYAERLKQRREAAAKQKEKAAERGPQLTGEALRVRLEEAQMDAIRPGKPPLPRALTPEMDDQLVSEGLLDPQ